jgi:DNA-binding MarR family transcriptional regulator
MPRPVSPTEYRALAEVRYRLRRFVNFSEERARAAGVEPQQHQLLLAIRGLPESLVPTIRTVAERLQIHHNSAVELVERTARRGLVVKRTGASDRRQVLLEVTARGRAVLEKLAVAHRTELASMAPDLLDALSALVATQKRRKRSS